MCVRARVRVSECVCRRTTEQELCAPSIRPACTVISRLMAALGSEQEAFVELSTTSRVVAMGAVALWWSRNGWHCGFLNAAFWLRTTNCNYYKSSTTLRLRQHLKNCQWYTSARTEGFFLAHQGRFFLCCFFFKKKELIKVEGSSNIVLARTGMQWLLGSRVWIFGWRCHVQTTCWGKASCSWSPDRSKCRGAGKDCSKPSFNPKKK